MATKVQTIRPFRSARQAYVAPVIMVCSLLLCAAYLYASKHNTLIISQSSRPEIVRIPVPLYEVNAGTRLRDIEFIYTEVASNTLGSDILRNIADVTDSITKEDLPAARPISQLSFVKNNSSTNALIERIPLGMRAMTLNVDETSAVEGWASSGATVDVLLIQNDRTSVVAERVKILSAERSIQQVERIDGEAPAIPKTVTILVTQEQCLAVSTALTHGKIAFALRSGNDEETWRSRSYLAERLKDSSALGNDAPKKIGGFVTIGDKRYALIDDRWVSADAITTPFSLKETDTETMRQTFEPLE